MTPKIAIIGGGTGLTLAWLLADHFDVTLYESTDRLGGHIQSSHIKQSDGSIGIIEAGTEFINPEYVNFYKLLEILKLELRSYTMKMEFIDYTKKDTVADYEKTYFSPGITDLVKNYSDVDKKCCSEGCCSGTNEFLEDSEKFGNLALLQYLIYQYNKTKHTLTNQTTKEFVESFSLVKNINKNFGKEFFYPFTNASWGIDKTNAEGTESREAEDFLAFYTLYYIAAGNTYQEVVGGLSKYINELYKQIKYKCNFKFKSKVTSIEKTPNKKYTISYKNSEFNDHFYDKDYDEVIVCTNLQIMNDLIKSLPDLENIKNKLEKVTYYTTKICLHESYDKDFDLDTVVHIKHTGDRSSLHITKPWNNKLTRSWVFKDQPDPENTLETVYYRHPNMNKSYYYAQEEIKNHNNKKSGIFFGGISSQFNDSHESAMTSNLNIAMRLSDKYKLQLDKLEHFDFKKIESKTCCSGCNCCIQ